jgi:hypothetical protein
MTMRARVMNGNLTISNYLNEFYDDWQSSSNAIA